MSVKSNADKGSVPMGMSMSIVALSLMALVATLAMLRFGGIFKQLAPVLIGICIAAGAYFSPSIRSKTLKFVIVAAGIFAIVVGVFFSF